MHDRQPQRIVVPAMVSFIVPAYNEELTLPGCLRSIREAMARIGGDFEIIVADDASTDRTAEVAAAAGCRVVSCHHRQIAPTRNAGAGVARGDPLVFVDADTWVSEALLRDAFAALDQGCVAGSARPSLEGHVPWWARPGLAVFTFFYFAANLGAGCFFYVRREAFERAGRFDERFFAGEETHLSRKLKKLGRFHVGPVSAVTSGRRVRLVGPFGFLRQCLRVVSRGPKGTRMREATLMWYDGKREDKPPAGEEADGGPARSAKESD